MIASNEQTDIQLPTFIPVNLTYQTAFVDDDGKLEFRDDVYGRDKALLAILKGDRKDADVADRAQTGPVAPAKCMAMPDQPSFFGGFGSHGLFGGGNYYPNGGVSSGEGNFFSRLFGGFARPAGAGATPEHPTRQEGNPVRR